MAAIAGLAFFNAARPGDVGLNSLLFFGGEEAGVALVAEDGQTGLFVQDFAAEWIDHTHGSFEYRAYDGMIKAASGDQLADEHSLVDQRNVEVTGNKLAIAILDLAWIGNDALQALQFEIFGKHPEFAVAGHFAPVENCDARRRSEEHTSELQSRLHLVCRLLLEKKNT